LFSETEHLAVLEMKNGAIFDGDVKHCGVGNISLGARFGTDAS
jgi:hypothetical protein